MKFLLAIVLSFLFLLCCTVSLQADNELKVDVSERVFFDQEMTVFATGISSSEYGIYIYFNDNLGATLFSTSKNTLLSGTPEELFLLHGLNRVIVKQGGETAEKEFYVNE